MKDLAKPCPLSTEQIESLFEKPWPSATIRRIAKRMAERVSQQVDLDVHLFGKFTRQELISVIDDHATTLTESYKDRGTGKIPKAIQRELDKLVVVRRALQIVFAPFKK